MKTKLVFLTSILFLVPLTAPLEFRISVEDVVNSSEYRLQHSENTAIQNINVTLENSGTIGCEYRLKGEFSYGNETRTRYSDPYPLFPGAQALAELHFIPENYTGEVETEVYSLYCGQEEKIGEFSFTSPEKVVPSRTLESRTLEVRNKSAKVELDIQEGRLVPSRTPSFWKASSAEISGGKATVRYEAPIFQEGEELTYTVVRNGSVVGETEVVLEEETTLRDRLEKHLFKILLGISVALNLGLLIRTVRNPSK